MTQDQDRLIRLPWQLIGKECAYQCRDTGSILDPGRSHMLQSYYAHVPQLLRLCIRALEPQLLNSHATAPEARAT